MGLKMGGLGVFLEVCGRPLRCDVDVGGGFEALWRQLHRARGDVISLSGPPGDAKGKLRGSEREADPGAFLGRAMICLYSLGFLAIFLGVQQGGGWTQIEALRRASVLFFA